MAGMKNTFFFNMALDFILYFNFYCSFSKMSKCSLFFSSVAACLISRFTASLRTAAVLSACDIKKMDYQKIAIQYLKSLIKFEFG